LRAEGIRNEKVLNAIAQVPRHEFVDEALSSRAYEDTALPIGLGQTISQPWIVARMTEALMADECPEKVLEVGTGSGYQAAILSHLVKEVYTVERIKELLKLARRRFHTLRLHNIHARYADGHLGWPTQAPFDAIIITAASQVIPDELIDQLRVGGKLVMPLERDGEQRLLMIRRTEEGTDITDMCGVVFVPMLSGLE
jgi:protein-L-isoaspartate(D-aspartate) O-methyltransferase